VHPNRTEPGLLRNDRYTALQFRASASASLHGFAGYFEARLFKGVLCSIKPETHSPDMYSWFPIYFPFRRPVPVKKGELIEIHVWRCSSSTKTWYEWALVAPFSTPIQNAGGHAYFLGL